MPAEPRSRSHREEINKLCIMDGALPKKDNEIVIDRMFADNNTTKTGDKLTIDGKTYTVSGLVSFSDYTTMFENNTDMMFDSVNFGVAMGTKEDAPVCALCSPPRWDLCLGLRAQREHAATGWHALCASDACPSAVSQSLNMKS